MGEMAAADIWARTHGLDGLADMTLDDWARFYREYDDSPAPRARRGQPKTNHKAACPRCGKVVKAGRGIIDHMKDVHGMTRQAAHYAAQTSEVTE